ncbi:hypothetical protein RCH21_002636 [Arthrobacter sp. PL16]|nr:hypothetical protein [Arthrobacter sp. PL16]
MVLRSSCVDISIPYLPLPTVLKMPARINASCTHGHGTSSPRSAACPAPMCTAGTKGSPAQNHHVTDTEKAHLKRAVAMHSLHSCGLGREQEKRSRADCRHYLVLSVRGPEQNLRGQPQRVRSRRTAGSFTRRIDRRVSSLSCLRSHGIQARAGLLPLVPQLHCSLILRSSRYRQELSYALLSATTRGGPDAAMRTHFLAARNAAGLNPSTR